jgi:tripartite-type tricarboxylate transporter receptor subunit TctC
MKLPHRRQFLHLAAGAAALPAYSRIGRAQTYPTRPVRLMVGFAAGGPADLFARLIAQWLSERLRQQFIVENRPGAGSNVAAEAVIRAPSDGYTLLLVSIANAVNATLYDNLNFNVVRDIAPIAGINRGPGVLVVNPSFPIKSVPEFIAYAKANPGKISYGSSGNGSVMHLYAELFKTMTGVNLVHVPYRGGGQVQTDLIGGQVQLMFDAVSTAVGHIKAGRLRPLAVTTATRVDAMPDTPTMGEFVPGYAASGWAGVGAPKNTPPEIIDKLNQEINAGLADAKIKARFAELSQMAISMTPPEFGKLLAEETEKWGKVIRAANIKPD